MIYMGLTKTDKETLSQYYKNALKENPDDYAKAVHWSSALTQYSRFKVLAGIGKLKRCKVLDVGCGIGELYKYFLHQRIDVDFTGIDLIDDYITIAQKRFPEGKFILGDFLEYEFNIKFDYVFASGIFNNRVSDNKAVFIHSLQKMLGLAKKGIVFNLLLKGQHPEDEEYITYSIPEAEQLVKNLGYEYKIVSGYLPYDFTVYIYKK
jgi:SAM-dependent methyltransferase